MAAIDITGLSDDAQMAGAYLGILGRMGAVDEAAMARVLKWSEERVAAALQELGDRGILTWVDDPPANK